VFGPSDWVALASAVVALIAMAISALQALSARRQAESASTSANSAQRAASAAERQVSLAEKQAAADALKNDSQAIAIVRPALRNALLAIPYVIYMDTALPPELFHVLQRANDSTGDAIAVAASDSLIDRLKTLRGYASTAAHAFRPSWYDGFQVKSPKRESERNFEDERLQSLRALHEFERDARAFLKDVE
jgi:hypothetical protein